MNISNEAMEKGIVMVTLQMLIDNAIKHNSLQPDAPLKICVWDENEYLHVKNNKQLRKQIAISNGQGLHQLRDLYSYLTGREIVIDDTAESFSLMLPLL
jgi:LytS/YehU family sensor histidine kinase